ncbi:MAG: cytochrome-c peroxidase [Chitinophagaceae bacterium]|nr:cytochrome-c peroxidase [Chitinophagaceae bacterium]
MHHKIYRNLPGKYTIAVFLIFFVVCCSFLINALPDTGVEINKYYTKKLQELKKKLLTLKSSCDQRQSLSILKNNFQQARLSYKQLAILTEYYELNSSRSLNGPAINCTEEDNPDKIIVPHGFQVIENYLFGGWKNKFYKIAGDEAVQMIAVLNLLENQSNREHIFRQVLVWDAIRSSSVRLVALGITGFDSPVAMLSLQEAGATIKGIKDLLLIFRQHADKKTFALYHYAFASLDGATVYLKDHTNFNNFDRLEFITKFITPFYKYLQEIRVVSDIQTPPGSYPVNFNAVSIFSDTSFNVNFFSPGGEYIVTKDRIQLGKKLFYDSILSGTKNQSCASCHKPELAFTDGLKTALSIDHKKFLSRNTPTILNSGLQSRQFFDSRADILENQLDEVVHNNEEMKGSLAQSIKDLRNNEEYNKLFREAYATEQDPVSGFNIANAISSYIRSLITLNSRFDQYMRGDKTKLTGSERKGFNLFMGKAKCATCHHPPLFNGLLPPDFIETESEVLGVPETTDTVNTKPDPDLGKYLFTKSSIHKYSFKTPTLRNIDITAPYMHNGVYKTLKEVVDFYNKGGGKGLKIVLKNQTLPFDKLNLSKKEIAEIISFMKSLTDTTYLAKQAYQ